MDPDNGMKYSPCIVPAPVLQNNQPEFDHFFLVISVVFDIKILVNSNSKRPEKWMTNFWHKQQKRIVHTYSTGNDHISHQKGKGKSSTQKCWDRDDVIVPWRVSFS